MDLPQTYLERLAINPFIIISGKIYLLDKSTNNESHIAMVDGIKYYLFDSETLAGLEDLYYTDNEAALDDFRTNYLNNELAASINEFKHKRLNTLEKSKEQIEKSSALFVILEKIIPAIEGINPLQTINYDEQLPVNYDKLEDKKKELTCIEEENYYNIERRVNIKKERYLNGHKKKEPIYSKKLSNCCNSAVKVIDCDAETSGTTYQCEKCKNTCNLIYSYFEKLYHFGMLIFGKKIYLISKKGKNPNYCQLDGDTFYLTLLPKPQFNEIIKDYQAYLEIIYKHEALKNCTKRFEQLDKLAYYETMLSEVLEKEKWDGKKGGFYRINNNRYVFYIKFDGFVNYFPESGKYYYFPPNRIAIKATYVPAKKDFTVSTDEITILDTYYHPFVDPLTSCNESHFCTGHYQLPKGLPGWQKIPLALNSSEAMLKSSYNKKNISKLRVYGHKNYHYKEVSPQWVGKNKIKVTNQNVQSSKS